MWYLQPFWITFFGFPSICSPAGGIEGGVQGEQIIFAIERHNFVDKKSTFCDNTDV